MNSIHADGGWVLALTLTALFAGLAFAAIRKRWPASRRPALVVVDGATVVDDKPKKTKAEEKYSHGHGSKHTLLSLSGVIALWVVIVVGVVYFIFHLPAIGDAMFRLAGIKVVQPQQVYVVPRGNVGAATIRYTNELPCPPWDRTRHVCTLSGTTDIVQAAGLPAGLTFCMTPGPDPTKADPKDLRWKSIRAIRDNGDRVGLDPAHPLTNLVGYELTPTHSLPVTYWFSDLPSCT